MAGRKKRPAPRSARKPGIREPAHETAPRDDRRPVHLVSQILTSDPRTKQRVRPRQRDRPPSFSQRGETQTLHTPRRRVADFYATQTVPVVDAWPLLRRGSVLQSANDDSTRAIRIRIVAGMPPRRHTSKDTPGKLAKRIKRRWRVVLLRNKGEILGEVEAPDVAAAKAAAAVQFDLDEIQRDRIMVQELA
jgi:hypothetical protein